MNKLDEIILEHITENEQTDDSNEAKVWEAQLEESLAGSTLKYCELRQGIIIDYKEDGLVVDIGAKRDGFGPLEDLENLDGREYTISDEVPVVVTRFRNAHGNVELSVCQALLQEDWCKAKQLLEDQTVHEATILAANRGG